MTTILTLHLDAASQAHFEGLRQLHFPPERNQIPAHLTLFHTLPDTVEITRTLASIATAHVSFALQVTGLRSLGRGVAYTLASSALHALHTTLAGYLAEHLSSQDRQRFQPHIVVQNKTTPERARILLGQLQATFKPLTVHATGLDLWHYLGGPWELAEHFPFARPLDCVPCSSAERDE